MKAAASAILILSAAALAACAPADGAPDQADGTDDSAYRTLGTKGVTAEQADWLSRSHTRPAGR